MFSTTADSISEELGDMFPMHAYVITARLYYINCNKFGTVLISDKMSEIVFVIQTEETEQFPISG